MSSECGPDGLPMRKQTAYTHAHTWQHLVDAVDLQKKHEAGGRGVIRHKHEILNKIFRETFTAAKML